MERGIKKGDVVMANVGETLSFLRYVEKFISNENNGRLKELKLIQIGKYYKVIDVVGDYMKIDEFMNYFPSRIFYLISESYEESNMEEWYEE